MINSIKQLILTLIFLILIIKVVSAQEYRPFPDSNAIWKITFLDVFPPPPWGYTHYYHYIIDGDTLVNALIYQKIYKIDYNYFCTNIILGTQYAGSIRENKIEERVYYLPPDNEQDILLYDFSLEVGDTLPESFSNILYPLVYIESIDSVLVNDNYHQRFILGGEYTDGLYLVEGVGSITGLLEDMIWFEEGGVLRCYELNDTLNTFLGYDTTYCILPTDTCYTVEINEGNHHEISNKIFPNPCSISKIYIEIQEDELPVTIEIYDIVGQLLLYTVLQENNNSIDIADFGKGMVLLTIRNKRNISTAKLILN